MNVLSITLLMANLVTVAAGVTVIGKEINKINKKFDEHNAYLFANKETIYEKLNKIHETLVNVEKGNDISSIRRELKEHISKEFMAMTFRTIKIQDLRTKEGVK